MKEPIPIKTTPPIYFPPLTGIRAAAAYLVFAYHFNPVSVSQSRFIHHVINELHVGVSVFFVLSGFLIALRYQQVAFTGANWGVYLRNRVARIYPLYFLLTTATFVYWAWVGPTSGFQGSTYLLNITFLKGFFNDLKFTGIAQGWSLTIEETFYILAPFIFWLARRSRLFLQPLALLSLSFLVIFITADFSAGQWFERSYFFLVYTFFGRCVEFYVGIQLARCIQNRGDPLTGVKYTTAGLTWMILCIVGMALISYPVTISLYQPMGVFINNMLFPLGVAMLFFGLVKEQSWLRRFLSNRFMQLAGRSSYAFYLVHIGIFQLLVSQWISAHPLILFIVLNLVALALYTGVEKPLQRVFRPK